MICPACGYEGEHSGPTHAYMSPSAACWARYGEVLAREYSDREYWKAHRLLTDAYCGQHSISDDRRARQSLYIHMAALMLHFEDHLAPDLIVEFLRKAAKSGHDFPHLAMPEPSLSVGIDSIFEAGSSEEHRAAVISYARAVFEVWTPHHGKFRALIEEIGR